MLRPGWACFLGLIIAAVCLSGCSRNQPEIPPTKRILAITHSALNRLTLYDPERREILGALPSQKLPHDMLLSRDGNSLYVVNSGSQCITVYHLDSPEFWRYAAAFMKKDSANLFASRSVAGSSMFGSAGGDQQQQPATARGDSVILNKDPVQSLPASVAEFVLTDDHFPEKADKRHKEVGAFAHTTCFDCHDRSLGGKPFGPAYTKDSSGIYLVHLGYKNIVLLDAKTLALKRRIPLEIPAQYSPIEVWLHPGGQKAFVTCRNEIGMSRPGMIAVVDLDAGKVIASIPAGIYPWHMLPDAEGKHLYVNNFQSSKISVVDIERQEIVDSISVQNGPSMMKWLTSGKLAVSCFYTDKIVMVDVARRTVIGEIAVDGNPTSIEESADGKELSVLCGGSGLLDQIDLKTSNVTHKTKMLFGAYACIPLQINRKFTEIIH